MKAAAKPKRCGAPWLPSRPEATCQLERGHTQIDRTTGRLVPGQHYYKNALYAVWWFGEKDIEKTLDKS